MTEQLQDELFSAMLDAQSLDVAFQKLSDQELIATGDEAIMMRTESEGCGVQYPFWSSVVKAFERQLAARFGGNGLVN